jgi:hypothetical protein
MRGRNYTEAQTRAQDDDTCPINWDTSVPSIPGRRYYEFTSILLKDGVNRGLQVSGLEEIRQYTVRERNRQLHRCLGFMIACGCGDTPKSEPVVAAWLGRLLRRRFVRSGGWSERYRLSRIPARNDNVCLVPTSRRSGMPERGGTIMALAWTTERPTISGWYWYRGKLADQVVLTCIGGGKIIIGNDVLPLPVVDCPGEWFGPVAPCGSECRF